MMMNCVWDMECETNEENLVLKFVKIMVFTSGLY